MKTHLFILLFGLMLSCKKENATVSATTLNYTKKEIVYKQIQGVDANLLSLDVYYDPDKMEPKPVIVWVHGGGWCIGDKTNQIEQKKILFASMGYLLVSINYRLSPFPYEPNNPQRIKFPIHNIDISDALKWVYENMEIYGGDSDKIVLMGHSAGAQLVALTGTNHQFLNEVNVPISFIKGIIAIDTRMYDVFDVIQNRPSVDLYINAFGENISDNIAASASRHLNDSNYFPNFLIIKRGTQNRLTDADNFIHLLEQNNISVQDFNANPYNHSEVNEFIGQAGETRITPVIKLFLQACFE